MIIIRDMKKVLLALVAATAIVSAQTPGSFTLEQILSYPFPDNLVASPVGSTIAWTFTERGVRNVYAATVRTSMPDESPRTRLTTDKN